MDFTSFSYFVTMIEPLSDLLRLATVRLTVARKIGTGSFVAPGQIVTCAHVVEAARSNSVPIEVSWNGFTYPAEILHYFPKPYPDLALLGIDLRDHPCIYLKGDAKPYDRLYCFGYTDEYPEGDSTTVECEGWTGKQELLKLKKGQVRPGLSGSPLLNLETDAVCGIVKSTRDRGTDLGGRALPTSTILSLIKELPEQQRRYHKVGTAWLKLLSVTSSDRPTKLPAKVIHPLPPAQYFVGRKPQMKALRDFWEKGRGGVIALVGIGGAGKTAIVQQFLESQQWLEDSDRPDAPDGLFVWSFYDAPSTTEFFNEAYRYFSRFIGEDQANKAPADQRANAFLLADTFEKADRRCLLVMDGLEKMQSSGSSDGRARGSLDDSSLRNLLERIADGRCDRTKAIITSRFSLSDLASRPDNKYRELNVDKLEYKSARSLLRKLGVRGTSTELDRAADEYGLHALTLDLLGRLLAEYYNGDLMVARNLPPLESATGSTMIDFQADRLSRVLLAYEQKLTPKELAAIERLSIFRQPVSFSFLTDIFLGDGKEQISGDLASLTAQQFKSVLYTLVSRRLVLAEKGQDNQEFFTSHPAIREHFYIRLTDPIELHDAVRTRLVSLVDAPGYIKPRDPRSIELLEELIYHTVKTGRTNEAYKVYKDRLGYLHLGWVLGDHAKGATVMGLFPDKKSNKGDIEQPQWERLMIDYGLYLRNLGRLDEAIHFCEKAVLTERSSETNPKNLALALQNLSAVQVLRGLLRDAGKSAQEALEHASKTTDKRLIADCQVRLATSLALRGQVTEAQTVFEQVNAFLRGEGSEEPSRDLPGIRLGWLLMRLKKFAEAMMVLEETHELSERFDFGILAARSDVLIAEIAAQTGKADEARRRIERVHRWALTRFDQEMHVAAHLASARLALIEENWREARRLVRDGLREAEAWGYSIYWIDLKIVQGHIELALGRLEGARDCANQALVGSGESTSGYRKVYGSRSAETGYLWGEGDALQLRAEANFRLGDVNSSGNDLLVTREIRATIEDPLISETESLLTRIG